MSAVLTAVQAHLACFNAGDLDGISAGFAEDCVLSSADGLVVGRRGVRALFGEAFAGASGARLELRGAVVDGDTAAVELVERIPVDAGTVELEVAAFYTVRAGEIARLRIYREAP